MRTFRKMIVQAFAILLISSVAGLSVNAIRPDGIGLLESKQSAVAANRENGEIGIPDATELFASGRGLFLDARTPWEFEAGRIQGALSLPPDEFDFLFPELEERLRSAEALITYCDGERCPLGDQLAEKLRGQGIENVFVLKNGWALWRAEKLPTEPSDLGALFGHNAKICAEDCAK
jgi:rhodanese-related sulfurtransferase